MQTQMGALRGAALPPQQLQHRTAGSRPAARQQAQRVTAIAAPPRPSSSADAAANIEPLADELKPLVEEKVQDWDRSGLKYLSNEARVSRSSWSLHRHCTVP